MKKDLYVLLYLGYTAVSSTVLPAGSTHPYISAELPLAPFLLFFRVAALLAVFPIPPPGLLQIGVLALYRLLYDREYASISHPGFNMGCWGFRPLNERPANGPFNCTPSPPTQRIIYPANRVQKSRPSN